MDCSSVIYENDIDTEENFSDIEESFNADIEENYNAEENIENHNAKENANIEENYKAIKEDSNQREEPNAKENKSEEIIYAECENYLKKRGYPAGASKLEKAVIRKRAKTSNSGWNSPLQRKRWTTTSSDRCQNKTEDLRGLS